jgi:hypothetical protein
MKKRIRLWQKLKNAYGNLNKQRRIIFAIPSGEPGMEESISAHRRKHSLRKLGRHSG